MKKEVDIRIRLTIEQKRHIQEKAQKYGFGSISEFMRVIAIKGRLEIKNG